LYFTNLVRDDNAERVDSEEERKKRQLKKGSIEALARQSKTRIAEVGGIEERFNDFDD